METDRNACKESPICSSSIDAINMWPLVCPHEKYPCGANSPEIELRLGLTLTLRVNKLFDLPDSCYYHIFASDQVSADDIEPYNLKHVQVYIESLTGMVGYVSSVNNGIENVVETEITEYNYNFTVPYSDDIYLILQAESGSAKGDYDAVIQFAYYEYDPNCVEFTLWNGTACANDYDAYCQSFQLDVEALYNPEDDPEIFVDVTYNGTDCVVSVNSTETVEQIEYIKSDTINEVIVQEIIQRDALDAEIIYVQEEVEVKDFQSGIRQEQVTMTAMVGVMTLGIFSYMLLSCLLDMRD